MKQLLSIAYIKEKWNHAGFRKYLHNTGWMFGARIISFVTSFFTVAIVARYLGPENLGKLDYAQSFVAIISVFASLGIDQILYRDLITHPEKENEFLGTAIYSKLVLGIFAFILSVVISILLGNEMLITTLVGICSLTFVINPIGTVGILFSAQVQARYSSHIAIFLAFFIPGIKLLAIFLHKGIIFFAVIIFIEALISTLWSIYIYKVRFKKHPAAWRFEMDIFTKLMHDSWPLLLAGFTGYVYAKMDQVLLLHFMNSATVGIYGVAVKLTQIWAFLPGLIITSLFPAIVNARKTDFGLYAKRLRALCGLTVGVTILIALPLFIFAPFIIHLIFGDAFITASPVLRIYLWTSVAITLVVLAQNYLVAENLSRVFLYTSIIGAVTNIVLNVLLIPPYGAIGSAWGTMASYLMVVVSLFIFKKSRDGIMSVFV